MKQQSRNDERMFGQSQDLPEQSDFLKHREIDKFRSQALSSTGKKRKPQLQSVRELGGEDNEATIEDEPEYSKDQMRPLKRNDTVDTVGNIESPQRTINMMTTDSHSREKVGGRDKDRPLG